MTLNKREKYIGIGAITAIALLAINSFVWEPYSEKLTEIEDATTAAQKDLSNARSLMARQAKLQPIWKQMVDGGLQYNESYAQNQASLGLHEWAKEAGIVPDIRFGNSSQEGPFQVTKANVDFTVSGNNSMRSVARMMWALETARIPIRVNDLAISAIHEGTDQLSVKLDVSVLCMPPVSNNTPPAGGQS